MPPAQPEVEQIKWERDTAIQQLKDLGYGLGEKIRTDGDTISRQAAIDAISTWDKFGVDERGRLVRWREGLELYVHLRDVLTAIVNLPSAQPEIIRCKDCKLYEGRPCGFVDWYNTADDFCSRAERREE